MNDSIPRNALYEQVADRVRGRIYNGELQPGQAIDEKVLCAAFGISRTPLREALKVLHAEGLVELVPRRGCFVKDVAFEELNELFPVMAVLEGLCARMAVRNCSARELADLEGLHARLEAHAAARDVDAYYADNFLFHQAVQNLSKNRWLQRLAGDTRKILRVARHAQLTLPGRFENSLNEHRQIMEAFRRGDEQMADECMQEHLHRQWRALVDLAASPGEGEPI